MKKTLTTMLAGTLLASVALAGPEAENALTEAAALVDQVQTARAAYQVALAADAELAALEKEIREKSAELAALYGRRHDRIAELQAGTAKSQAAALTAARAALQQAPAGDRLTAAIAAAEAAKAQQAAQEQAALTAADQDRRAQAEADFAAAAERQARAEAALAEEMRQQRAAAMGTAAETGKE